MSAEVATYWVYVIQSLARRPRGLAGFHYVGCTTDPARRLRQHNGELVGGGRYTAKYRPWQPRALFGPYSGRREAMQAEYALKHSKRGVARTLWSATDHPLCRGLGRNDPWVLGATRTPT